MKHDFKSKTILLQSTFHIYIFLNLFTRENKFKRSTIKIIVCFNDQKKLKYLLVMYNLVTKKLGYPLCYDDMIYISDIIQHNIDIPNKSNNHGWNKNKIKL